MFERMALVIGYHVFDREVPFSEDLYDGVTLAAWDARVVGSGEHEQRCDGLLDLPQGTSGSTVTDEFGARSRCS
jgi:hypothetical protein